MSEDQAKITSNPSSEALPPPKPASTSWLTFRRKLKHSLLAFLMAIMLLTTIAWVRSYYVADRLHIPFVSDASLLSGLMQGRMMMGIFGFRAEITHLEWQHVKHYKVNTPSTTTEDDRTEFLEADMNKIGLGIVRKIHYSSLFSYGDDISFSATKVYVPDVRFEGFGLIVPHWIVLLATVSLFMLIALGRQFSLRMLMLWVTIVCLLVGGGMATDKWVQRQFDEASGR